MKFSIIRRSSVPLASWKKFYKNKVLPEISNPDDTVELFTL